MSSKNFFKPRLVGSRFEGHSLPLELMDDFARLGNLIKATAKWVYLQENEDRERLPRGFDENISLELSGLEEGSTLLPILLVYGTMSTTNPNHIYYEKARDCVIEAIEAAEQGHSVRDYLPPALLSYFKSIGTHLRANESIEFGTARNRQLPTKLTMQNRERLISASTIEETYKPVVQFGTIKAIDRDNKEFTFVNEFRKQVLGTITREFRTVILSSVSEFENTPTKLKLAGTGVYDEHNRLKRFENITYLNWLDPMDVSYRIYQLSHLRQGWLNGIGEQLPKEGLEWFDKTFNRFYPEELPPPHIYPTEQSGLQAEWSNEDYDVSLNVDLLQRTAIYDHLDFRTDTSDVINFNLNDESDWGSLIEKIRNLNLPGANG